MIKLTKRLALYAAVLAFGLCSCGEKDPEIDPNKPGTEVPDNQGGQGDQNGDINTPVPTFQCDETTITIDPTKRRQTMEGFGASDCWLGNIIGNYWTSNRSEIAQALFSQVIKNHQPLGIGLSMWRVNLGAGTAEIGAASGIHEDSANNRAESYLSSSGTYNWNKCAGQRYFMDYALKAGCEKFVLFSNSPLVQYTRNGQGRSDSGGYANLKEDCYDDFAEYMAEVAAHFSGMGYNISHISPVNEPQYNWDGDGQEGSGWYNREIAQLTRELSKSLTSRGLSTRILLSEAAAWTDLTSGSATARGMVAKAFFDPASTSYVGDLPNVEKAMAVHSYWTFDNFADMRTTRSKGAVECDKYGIIPWQTEWSMLDACPSELGGNYDTISEFDIALYMSKVIHNDLTSGNCASWSYWTAMSVERWSQKNRFELIKTTPNGGHYDNNFTAGGTVELTDNLWVLGNYSRFVRPGYVRITTNKEISKEFFATSYISPDSKTLVVVCSNYYRNKGMKLKTDLSAFGKIKEVYTYTTTASKHLKEVQFNPGDQVFVDPYSITTVVYTFE